MRHQADILQDGIYHRFTNEAGTVIIKVVPVRYPDVASLVVYEMTSAIAAIGLSDEEGHALDVTQAQRNRFGTGFMLRALKTVRATMPEVKTWVWERKSGLYPHVGAKEVSDAVPG